MSKKTSGAPRVSLEVLGGKNDGLRYLGDKAEIHMGRSAGGRGKPANDLVLAGDINSSGTHAKVYWADGEWYFKDLGSTNGSKIRGKSQKENSPPEILSNQELFLIGSSVIEFGAAPESSDSDQNAGLSAPSAAADKMMQRASALAAERKSDFFGVEHLFCAIAESDAALIQDLFKSAGVSATGAAKQVITYERWKDSFDWIRKELAKKAPAPSKSAPKKVKETPRLKNLRNLAEEARSKTDAPGIEPIHLLIAILQERRGTPALVLEEMGQSCAALAETALRMTQAHFTPEEEDEEESSERTMFAAPKRERRPPVDHATWLAVREIVDELTATQARYQLADPKARFDSLKTGLRTAMANFPPDKRPQIFEQLRLLFPLSSAAGEALPEFPPSFVERTSAGETPAPPTDTPSTSDSDVKTPSDFAAPTGPLDPALLQGLRTVYRTSGSTEQNGDSPSSAEDEFQQLSRLFYEYTKNTEQFVIGVLSTISGGGQGATWNLPMSALDISSRIDKLLKEGDPDSIGEIRDYLAQLQQWLMALITSFQMAMNEWNQKVWDGISPAAIREDSKVSAASKLMGRGPAELWQIYEKKIKDWHPEVAGDEFRQLLDRLMRKEFQRLNNERKKNG